MPEIGEIQRGSQIGKARNRKYIWQACARCDRERWVELRRGKPRSTRCIWCVGKA